MIRASSWYHGGLDQGTETHARVDLWNKKTRYTDAIINWVANSLVAADRYIQIRILRLLTSASATRT